MSIDNATPAEWNKINRKKDWAWMDAEDNEPNDHPRFSEEAMSKTYDPVNRPEHYNTGGLECIDAIRGMLTHDEYIRYKKKPIEDLRKARWYEERLMNYMLEHPSDK